MIWYYGQDPVQKNQECAVPLGIQGENQSLVYTADVSDWLALWPNGVVALVLQAPDKSEPYMGNTSLDRENGVVTWTITNFDTSVVGYGFGELRIVENDVVKKSYRFATYIRPSILASAAEPPAPIPDWINDLLEAADNIQEAVDAAEAAQAGAEAAQSAAETAAASALATKSDVDTLYIQTVTAKEAAVAAQTGATQSMEVAAQAKADAVLAKKAAVDAQDAAELAARNASMYKDSAYNAKNSAQAAQTAAETAQGKAETAQAAAETAQTGAETALASTLAAKDTAISAITSQQATSVAAVTAEGTAQKNAVQAKGQEVIASIPQDYTALSTEVGDLKSALNGFEDNVNHGIFTPVLEVGDYDIVSGVLTPNDGRKCYIRVATGYHLQLDVGDVIGLSSYSGFGFTVFYKHDGASGWSATGKLYADYTVSAKGEFVVTVGANPMDYTVVYTNPYSVGVSVFVRNAHSVKDKIDNVAKQTEAIPYITMEDFIMNVRGGYRSNNQTFYVSDDIKSTEAIPFSNKKVSQITAKTRINNTFYKVVFFDENKNIMQGISLVNESSDSVDAVDVIDVTGTAYDNACYVLATTYRPNVYTGKLLTLYSQSYVTKLKQAIGAYPDFSILGDSFSTFASYTVPEGNNQWYPNTPTNDVDSVTDTWWYKFGSAKSCVLRQNNSYSGAPICYDGYGTGTIDAKNYCLATRVSNLMNASLVIIEGATNDSSVGVGLGEYTYSGWDDTNMIYYRPALAYLLDYAKNHFLGAQIIFMLNNGLDAGIVESTETICAHYDIPLLKLSDINKQASHPSKAGMAQIAEQLIAFLDALT